MEGGEQTFFFLKCSTHTCMHTHAHTHTSSATNSHNYLYESWTGRSPISVKGPVFFFVFFVLTSACAGFQRRKTAAVLKKIIIRTTIAHFHIFTSLSHKPASLFFLFRSAAEATDPAQIAPPSSVSHGCPRVIFLNCPENYVVKKIAKITPSRTLA